MKDPLETGPRCPVRTTLEMLGGKWKLMIIAQLGHDTLRFTELRRGVPGISEKMLVQELKSLMDSGLVERINYGEVPPRVDYRLTLQGKLALPLIDEIRKFGVGYVRSTPLSAEDK